MTIGPLGWILFLSYDKEKEVCSLMKAQLHNPINKIEVLKSDMKATEVHYKDGLIFCSGNESGILFLDFNANRSRVSINVSKLKRRADLVNVLSELEMPTDGTITTMSRRLKAKLDEVNEVYMRKGLMKDQINFSDTNKDLKFDSIAVIDSKLMQGHAGP